MKANSGLSSLIGKSVTLMCLNYIYTGTLVGVDDVCVELQDASIVYETGPFDDKGWKDAQRLQPGRDDRWYVQIGAIESFGVLK